MDITVTFRHTEPSEPLKEYAEKKIGKIVKYLDEPIEVDVVLSVEKIRNLAEATIQSRSMTIRAREESEDMYSSIDLVADKIEKQVRKYRDKIKSHKTFQKTGRVRSVSGMREETPVEAPRILRIENKYKKPMTPEDAAIQLAASGSEFILFTDAEEQNVCLLYRRKDGDLGLMVQPL